MIRETRHDDWRLLRDVRLRALAEAPYAFLTTLEEASAHPDGHWRERAAPTADRVTFVADAGERFDGLVAGFLDGDPTTVHLVSMWVAPELRGSGIAAQLVESVVGWARGRGAARVVLLVEAGNDRARRLYERCGFSVPAEPPALPYEPHEGSTALVRAT